MCFVTVFQARCMIEIRIVSVILRLTCVVFAKENLIAEKSVSVAAVHCSESE